VKGVGGFRRNKTYTLAWEEGELQGLEIVTRSMSVGRYLDMIAITRADDENVDMIGELISQLSRVLVSWNLEDEDGVPVPATREGLLSVDMELMGEITSAWQKAMSGANVPKDETLPSGSPSLVASIPMESLSESLAI